MLFSLLTLSRFSQAVYLNSWLEPKFPVKLLFNFILNCLISLVLLIISGVCKTLAEILSQHGIKSVRLPTELDLEDCTWLPENSVNFYKSVSTQSLEAGPCFAFYGIEYVQFLSKQFSYYRNIKNNFQYFVSNFKFICFCQGRSRLCSPAESSYRLLHDTSPKLEYLLR